MRGIRVGGESGRLRESTRVKWIRPDGRIPASPSGVKRESDLKVWRRFPIVRRDRLLTRLAKSSGSAAKLCNGGASKAEVARRVASD